MKIWGEQSLDEIVNVLCTTQEHSNQIQNVCWWLSCEWKNKNKIPNGKRNWCVLCSEEEVLQKDEELLSLIFVSSTEKFVFWEM
jgi:hypothetical protein